MGLFRWKYGSFTFDEFTVWQEEMFELAFSVSSYPGDYGQATCLGCRAIVSIGVPEITGLQYAERHRKACRAWAR